MKVNHGNLRFCGVILHFFGQGDGWFWIVCYTSNSERRRERRWTSPVAKGPAEPRTGSVVTHSKARWRLVVPISGKRHIPRQVTEQLEVVRCIRIETDTARIRQGGKKSRSQVQVGFLELEELYLRHDQSGRNILSALRGHRWPVVGALPAQTAEHGDARMVGVHEKTPNTATQRGLKRDSLHRALQEIPYSA
jgi:hypothetical protein